MEGVVELNCCRLAVVQYLYHQLPQNSYQPYASGVSVRLWGQDEGIPGVILRKVTPAEGNLQPSPRAWSQATSPTSMPVSRNGGILPS